MSTEEHGDGRDDSTGSANDAGTDATRRRFLSVLSVTVAAAVGALAAAPLVAMFLSPLISRARRRWVPIGRVSDFEIGRTVEVTYRDVQPLPWAGYSSHSSAWLRREADAGFTVLSAYCTHVGCPLRWVEGAELFLCPCHGGAFHRDGAVAAGPPPRPLPLLPVRVRRGVVEVLPQPITATTTV